jgi:hypothetical protein
LSVSQSWEAVMTMTDSTVGKPETKPHALIASDRVEGTAVRRSNGDKIGNIQRLMIDKVSGNVAYAVLSFGGFLGMGEKHLPVPWTSLKYDPLLGAYAVDLSDDELARSRPGLHERLDPALRAPGLARGFRAP